MSNAGQIKSLVPEASGRPYRLTFRLMQDSTQIYVYNFTINPQSYQVSLPNRIGIMQTLAGGFAQVFGPGLPTIQIQGTTGIQVHPDGLGGQIDGITSLQNMYENVYLNFTSRQFTDPTHTYELRFYNWTLEEYYNVVFSSNGFMIQQDTQHPIWYYYTINMTVLNTLPAPTHFTGPTNAGQYLSPLPPAPTPDAILSQFTINGTNLVAKAATALGILMAQINYMLVQGNLAALSTAEQALLQIYPVPDLPPIYQLNNINYPGYAQYTGMPGQFNSVNSLEYILDTYVRAIIGANANPLTQGTVPLSLATIQSAISQLRNFMGTFESVYGTTVPSQFLNYCAQVMQQLSAVAAAAYVLQPA